jgi:hypothetical protein
MASSQQEAGLVADDGFVHATHRRVLGNSAACGAGKIVVAIVGRFDPDDRLACPQCTVIVAV